MFASDVMRSEETPTCSAKKQGRAIAISGAPSAGLLGAVVLAEARKMMCQQGPGEIAKGGGFARKRVRAGRL
jgi:hypothetical protein